MSLGTNPMTSGSVVGVTSGFTSTGLGGWPLTPVHCLSSRDEKDDYLGRLSGLDSFCLSQSLPC